MNGTGPISLNTTSSSMKMLRAMVGIGTLCALLIVLTFEGTLPRVERLKAEALEKAIFKVLPGTVKTITFIQDQSEGFKPVNTIDRSAQVVYAGYDENDGLVGIAIEASGQGYADVIRILYGYDLKTQKIIGFHVLESKETPGLGDKIEKDANFLANFNELDVSLTDDLSTIKNPVTPVKQGTKKHAWEVDGITGATISSRAIGNIIDESTRFWTPLIYKNKDAFLRKKEER